MTVTGKTTLAELIGMVADAKKEEKMPTAKKLREGFGVIAENENCTVYGNGYAVYENETGRTVMWLKDCTTFTWYFDNGSEANKAEIRNKETLPEGYLEAQPWALAVTLIGDHRIEANSMNRSGSRNGTRDYDSDDNGDKDGDAVKAAEDFWQNEYTWRDGRFGESPETAVLRNESRNELLKSMTDKQREVFLLYYRDGYNQEEIGEMLGLGRTSVEDRLAGALKKVKKI